MHSGKRAPPRRPSSRRSLSSATHWALAETRSAFRTLNRTATQEVDPMTTTGLDTPLDLEEQLDQEQVDRANASGRRPVVFVHGLWLLPSGWNRWAALFEEAGLVALTPGWPDDPQTVEEAAGHPEVFAGKTVGQVADHVAGVIQKLHQAPAIVGHSFGGLITQILAGRGLATASVAIDPAPFRGVLPLPFSALRAGFPVLKNPSNRNRAVPLTFEQFRFAFANAVSEEEAQRLFETFAVPASGAPIWQAAAANINPWSETRVDNRNSDAGAP